MQEEAERIEGHPASVTSQHADEKVEQGVVEVLQSVYDPEIPVNIFELGLIYNVDISAEGKVDIRMTLTSPMCPVAETLPPEVQERVAEVEGVAGCEVDVVWDPPWTMEMMSEAAKLQLGML